MVNEIVYINPSHQHANIGVGGYGTEADNCYRIANRVVELLKKTGLFKAVYLGEYGLSLADAIAEAKALGATIVLDIHTDAGGGRGCTGLYKSAKGKSFITAVYNRVTKITPTEDRGLARRTDLGILNQTCEVAGLIEMIFHDSKEDVDFFVNHKEEFAVAIAEGICDYCGVKLVQPKPVEPVKPVVDARKEFIKSLQRECNEQGLKDIRGMALTVDGIAGNHTLEALAKVVLREGSRGDFVKILQSRLGATADGIFGAKTKAKVIEYQRSMKLSPDGIVGYNTWFALCNR